MNDADVLKRDRDLMLYGESFSTATGQHVQHWLETNLRFVLTDEQKALLRAYYTEAGRKLQAHVDALKPFMREAAESMSAWYAQAFSQYGTAIAAHHAQVAAEARHRHVLYRQRHIARRRRNR